MLYREGFSGLGAVTVPGGAKTEGAAAGATQGAAAGGVWGAAAGAAIGFGQKAMEEKKKSAEGRTQRKAAATPLNEGLTSLKKLRTVTVQYRGNFVPDTTYREFMTELGHAVNNINLAIKQVKASRGIQGLGRTEAEKRADTIAWAQLLEKQTQAQVDEIVANISSGREKVAPAVESVGPAPSYAAPGAPAAPSTGGSMAALLPLALLLFLK